jgi:hypothetical protein
MIEIFEGGCDYHPGFQQTAFVETEIVGAEVADRQRRTCRKRPTLPESPAFMPGFPHGNRGEFEFIGLPEMESPFARLTSPKFCATSVHYRRPTLPGAYSRVDADLTQPARTTRRRKSHEIEIITLPNRAP